MKKYVEFSKAKLKKTNNKMQLHEFFQDKNIIHELVIIK